MSFCSRRGGGGGCAVAVRGLGLGVVSAVSLCGRRGYGGAECQECVSSAVDGKKSSFHTGTGRVDSSRIFAKANMLEEWLRASGGTIDQRCAIKPPTLEKDANERGVVATQYIAEGELLVSIPADLLLIAGDGDDDLPEDGKLAWRLLAEVDRGDASPWHAWIQELPVAFDMPLTWSDESSIDSLRCPLLIERLQRQRSTAAQCFAALESSARAGRPSMATYLWAHAAIESRCIYLDDDELGARGICLVPIGTLLTHIAQCLHARLRCF